MRIETGTPEDHPTPLPYDPGAYPALALPTEVVPGQLSGPTVPACDMTGEALAQMAAGEADVRAAQTAGQSAENDRRSGYHKNILPLGAEHGPAGGARVRAAAAAELPLPVAG